MIIAVVGNGDGCGKTTAAHYLAKHLLNAQVVETGDVLRKMMRIAHSLPDAMDDKAVTAKYRVELRALGDYIEDIAAGTLAAMAMRHANSLHTVIAGVRRMQEVEVIRHYVSHWVYIDRDDCDPGNCDILSLRDVDPVAGITGRGYIVNSGTIADLDAACHRLAAQWRAGDVSSTT